MLFRSILDCSTQNTVKRDKGYAQGYHSAALHIPKQWGGDDLRLAKHEHILATLRQMVSAINSKSILSNYLIEHLSWAKENLQLCCSPWTTHHQAQPDIDVAEQLRIFLKHQQQNRKTPKHSQPPLSISHNHLLTNTIICKIQYLNHLLQTKDPHHPSTAHKENITVDFLDRKSTRLNSSHSSVSRMPSSA